jgi:predicted alpha/beta superfamily hydrolase
VQRRSTRFLTRHGYRVAPVTIDNNEWIYADAYADAWNRVDTAVMERLGRDYVRYMLEVVAYYESQALAIAGEPIPHTLLVHAYALNADWLDPLLDALEARGYGWVSLEEATGHPVYARVTDGYAGEGGISWLHRWAITEGRDAAIFRGEPEVPDWVRELASEPATTPDPSPPPPARPLVVDRAEVHQLVSRVNGVAYELKVALPHGLGEPERRFPVVYLLDAEYSVLIARNIADHLAERDHLEEVIVVGVGYRNQGAGPTPAYRRNRTRDYTPTFVPTGGYGPILQQDSGGGPAFREALEKEILPFVEGRYPTRPERRTLVGHSYGGLFVLWTLMTRPELFAHYVAVSPSLWYDDQLVLRLEDERATADKPLPARLYLCAGSRENPQMAQDLVALTQQLRRHDPEGLQFQGAVLPNETHNSIFPGCLSNGLRYVLEGR